MARDRAKVLACEPADQAEGAAADITRRQRACDCSLVAGDEPTHRAAVACLHTSERDRRLDGAGIAADEAAGLQVRDVRTSDVAARERIRNQALAGTSLALIATNKSAQRRVTTGARSAGDVPGRECIGDGAAVDCRKSASDAIHPHAHGAARARLAGRAELGQVWDGCARDRAKVLACEPADQAEGAAADITRRQRACDCPLVAGDEPTHRAAVACLHTAERDRRLDGAGIAADEAAGLQVRDVRASDIAARERIRNQALAGISLALIATNESAQRRVTTGARSAGDVSGRECIGDGAAVDCRKSASDAVHPHAHGAARARLAGRAERGQVWDGCARDRALIPGR